MNCLEFRRVVIADPRRLDAETATHVERCAACRDFLVRALAFEGTLAAALRVSLPEGLRERLLDRTARTRRPYGWLALAAGVLVAIAMAFALTWTRDDPLALAGIDFVVYEEAQAIADAKGTDIAVLERVAAGMGVSLSEQLGELRYMGTCPIAGATAHHVLVRTPLGKVTLLLIPERALGSRVVASAHGFEAAVVPARGGSFALIGDSSRSIRRAETLLKAAAALKTS